MLVNRFVIVRFKIFLFVNFCQVLEHAGKIFALNLGVFSFQNCFESQVKLSSGYRFCSTKNYMLLKISLKQSINRFTSYSGLNFKLLGNLMKA